MFSLGEPGKLLNLFVIPEKSSEYSEEMEMLGKPKLAGWN